MPLYDRRFDPARAEVGEANPRTTYSFADALPLILAVALAALLLAVFFPDRGSRVGDTTNTGPSVRTVAPQPSPSTSPAVPTPNPTAEPRTTTQPPVR